MGHRWRARLGSLFEGWIEQFTHRPLLVAAVSLSVGIAAHLSTLNLIFVAFVAVFFWDGFWRPQSPLKGS